MLCWLEYNCINLALRLKKKAKANWSLALYHFEHGLFQILVRTGPLDFVLS